MINFLRKKGTSIAVWLILGVLALAFGLSFGLPTQDIKLGGGGLAKVHGVHVRPNDFVYQYNAVSRTMGIPKDPRFQEQYGVKEEVLETIVERIVYAEAAEAIGLAANTEDAELLTRDGKLIVTGQTFPFLGSEQEFNYSIFSGMLREWFMVSEPKYLEIQRQELLARTMRDLLASTIGLSEVELRNEYDSRENQISLRYIQFPSVYYSEIVDPSPAEIADYKDGHIEELANRFEAQGSRFMKLPAQLRLRLLAVARPPNEEMGNDPNHKDITETANQQARDTIENARKRILGGESFASVARDLSTDAGTARAGGDYGWITVEGSGSGLESVIDETAKQLPLEEISAVLEGLDAYYLVRIDGKREGDVAKSDAIEELAYEAVKKDRGKILAKQAAQEALLAVNEGATMAKLFRSPDVLGASAPGIEQFALGQELARGPAVSAGQPRVEETGLFARGRAIPGIGANADLTQACWKADPSREAIDEVFETAAGYLIAGVENKQEGTDEGFTESREQLYRELSLRRGAPILAKFGKRRCLEARGRGDIKPNNSQIKRQLAYETSDTVDDSGKKITKPYAMCDRVGGQGNILKLSAALAGSRQ